MTIRSLLVAEGASVLFSRGVAGPILRHARLEEILPLPSNLVVAVVSITVL